jgi:hypothetical protein
MTDVVLRIQTMLGGAVADVSRFRKEIAATQTTTLDLRETWKLTTADIIEQTQKQIVAEKEKVDQYRQRDQGDQRGLVGVQEGQRRAADRHPARDRHATQAAAALGETAAVAGRAGSARASVGRRNVTRPDSLEAPAAAPVSSAPECPRWPGPASSPAP